MDFKKTLSGFVAGLALLGGIAYASIVTLPLGLGPGDQYRLAFHSNTIHSVSSSDINHYNAIIQSLADAVPELSALGQNWNVIGSTTSVDARTNTRTTLPLQAQRVYRYYCSME